MLDISCSHIDGGNAFDFGRTARDYARFRDIYPASLYRKLRDFGVVGANMRILDVGTGSGVLPRNLGGKDIFWAATDISAEQIEEAGSISGGADIDYRVAAAEHSPFGDHSFDLVMACQCFWYFNIPEFVAELRRILLPQGRFCRIAMEWLPFESEIASLSEQTVLLYNPVWSGCNYQVREYKVPDWSSADFELETVHSYRENLEFSLDAWCGRMRSCRGIGASLDADCIRKFDGDLRQTLQKFGDTLIIPHHIRFEVYRLK